MFKLETDRLVLRHLATYDVPLLYEIISDAETMRFYPKPYSRDEAEYFINRSIGSYHENGFGLWAVIYKEEQRFIGQGGISLQNIDEHRVPEIGYQINKKYWNRGLATELAVRCLEYGFHELNMEEIYIHTFVKNIPSIRVAEKSGMKRKKEYDKIVDATGKIMRHVVFSLKKDEFKTC